MKLIRLTEHGNFIHLFIECYPFLLKAGGSPNIFYQEECHKYKR